MTIILTMRREKDMTGYRYKKIDAFTSNGSMGNPAACIYLGKNDGLSEKEMLTVAQHHKGFISEMVYCVDIPGGGVKLTYYSSECEVDFCGHGTIACLYDLIKNEPRFRKKKEVRVKTNKKGDIVVYNEIESKGSIFIAAPPANQIGIVLPIQDAADALSLPSGSISTAYPIDLIDAGLATLIVPIANLYDEVCAFPDEKRLKDFCFAHQIDIVLIYCLECADEKNKAHTRVFAPKFGYLEDPATGSGNSAFGYYMLKNDLWRGGDISIEQGGEGRVFNTIMLKTKEQRVLFGGRATVRIEGTYYL